MKELNATCNVIVSPKSLVPNWEEHIKTHYSNYNLIVYKNQDLSDIKSHTVIVVTYDLIWRRPQFSKLKDFTLLLDEAQAIKHTTSKRSKFITKMKFKNLIMLSGTVCAGSYEHLHPFAKLLGWQITKDEFWTRYVNFRVHNAGGIPIKIVTGYKNVEDLKLELKKYGSIFMKASEVIKLPESIETIVKVDNTKEYKTFVKDSIVTVEGLELVGDASLAKLLYLRQLSAMYNPNKWQALNDLLESSEDRFIIFYNFVEEFNRLKALTKRPISYVNGSGRDLTAYETKSNSLTLIQYAAGSSGLNLQIANKIIYFSLPLSADQYLQSTGRIRRLGQERTCFYYYLITKNSIEEDIFKTLKKREDYTLKLFENKKG